VILVCNRGGDGNTASGHSSTATPYQGHEP
jgi:hypothetical protein